MLERKRESIFQFTEPMELRRENLSDSDKERLDSLIKLILKEDGREGESHSLKESYFRGRITSYVIRDPISQEIAGTGSLFLHNGRLSIANLATAPEYQKQGVARKMMLFLIDRARAMGYREVYLDPMPQGQKLYRELKFGLSHIDPDLHTEVWKKDLR